MNSWLEIVSHYLRNSNLTSVLLDTWLKSLVVLAVAGGMCFCWRRASAAMRHWAWFLATASLVCLPFLTFIVPAWERSLWAVSTDLNSGNQLTIALEIGPGKRSGFSLNEAKVAATKGEVPLDVGSRRTQRIATQFNAGWLVAAPGLWFAGFVAVLCVVGMGRFRLRLIRRGAQTPESGDWLRIFQELCRELDIRRPVLLLQSADNVMPMTWGGWHPVVLLPAEADQWSAARLRVVLWHELAHVKRWDCLTQTITRMICALFWFNPLVWVASRRMCIERERACDDRVLNGGYKASEYASHLIEIARMFRRVPRADAIAMARPSGLERRVTAIVDCGRNRKRPTKLTAAITALAVFGFAMFIGVCATPTKESHASWSIERSAVGDQLKRFVAEKMAQAGASAKPEGKEILPEYKAMFAAGARGDWLSISNLWEDLRRRAPQYEGADPKDDRLQGTAWQTMLEIWGAFGNIAVGEEKYVVALARDAIAAVPAGSIYFGGTDPGRCVITALQRSHVHADPFFTITQNALADGSYLEYVRRMYGGKIQTPTDEDSKKCFQEYSEGALERSKDKKLKPGEDVKIVEGKVQVTGQVAVMAINALLSRIIFDSNPDREFYVEESFPLDWMYPHLSPAGPILKLNRQPLTELSDESIRRDREYWTRFLEPMVGDWLRYDTSVQEVAEFAAQAFAKQPEPDRFNHIDGANKWASKLRSSIAGLYLWRAQKAVGASEKARMIREADFAFRQAFATCPYSPEALFRYVNLLVEYGRVSEAVLIADAAVKLQPTTQFRALVKELKRIQKAK